MSFAFLQDRPVANGGLLAAVLAACALAGCGGGDGKTYGSVSGRVTASGKPVVEAIVLFQEPAQRIFVQTTTDDEGRYSFASQPGEGLPVGHYQIAIQPPLQEIRTGEPLPPPKPFPKLAPKYLDPAQSGVQLEVRAGDNPMDIELPVGG